MILMNTEKLRNKKGRRRLTVSLKERKAFPPAFANAPRLTVTVICLKNNVALCSYSYATPTVRKRHFSRSDCEASRNSQPQPARPSPFLMDDELAETVRIP